MRVDGDSALLGFFVLVGLIPVAADLSQGRDFGALSTLAGAMVLASSIALGRRAWLLLRARALRRRLLRWSR